jgi:hypothetical protein
MRHFIPRTDTNWMPDAEKPRLTLYCSTFYEWFLSAPKLPLLLRIVCLSAMKHRLAGGAHEEDAVDSRHPFDVAKL